MIVLESGHYYQVRITRTRRSATGLEAVDSMLPANAALPDSLTPLPSDQPPEFLRPILFRAAGT